MKYFLLITSVVILKTAWNHQTATTTRVNEEARLAAISNVNQSAIGCSPRLDLINFEDSTRRIPLLEGWGSYRMPVSPTNDSAYLFFQQGINMYYGFHIIEALASFERCIQSDPDFAMGYWGKALAYGPNINDIGYTASPEALEATEKARQLAGSCSPLEQSLIQAMQVRYSNDSNTTRERLNQQYADAMQAVYARFPNDADAAALYADALMVQHPWDLYDRHYLPKAWTPAIVEVLEKLVNRFPLHPGGAHYYIHAVEGSRHPEKALPAADRLGNLMPGVAHLVHMPSHIYIRTGRYSRGFQVNSTAVKSYYQYQQQFQPVTGNAFLYLMHNLHMQTACAMMDGQYANALRYAGELSKNIDASLLDAGGYFGVYGQYLHQTPGMIRVRFGRWADILQLPAVPSARIYEALLNHFARGMAFARTHRTTEAREELQLLQSLMQHPQLQESPAAFNPGSSGAGVAEKLLEAVIAEETSNNASARLLFEEAVSREDGMLYNEPRDWLLPARQYYGQFLLNNGDLKKAGVIFKEDLQINPANPWSLSGLEKVLRKQGKTTEAAKTKQQLLRAAARADIPVTQSVY